MKQMWPLQFHLLLIEPAGRGRASRVEGRRARPNFWARAPLGGHLETQWWVRAQKQDVGLGKRRRFQASGGASVMGCLENIKEPPEMTRSPHGQRTFGAVCLLLSLKHQTSHFFFQIKDDSSTNTLYIFAVSKTRKTINENGTVFRDYSRPFSLPQIVKDVFS